MSCYVILRNDFYVLFSQGAAFFASCYTFISSIFAFSLSEWCVHLAHFADACAIMALSTYSGEAFAMFAAAMQNRLCGQRGGHPLPHD